MTDHIYAHEHPESEHKRDGGFTLWFTGLSGSGKSTIAHLVGPELDRRGLVVEYLDGVTKRVGKADALVRLRQIDSSALWRVEPDSDEDHARAREVFVQYDDQAINMTDSLSFAIMERLRLGQAFTFDPDFETHGFERLPRATHR